MLFVTNQQSFLSRSWIIWNESLKGKKQKLNYKTRGIMANIGRRKGAAIVLGMEVHGFIAWFLWWTLVMTDWTTDLLFKPDVIMIKRFTKYAKEKTYSDKRAKNHCKKCGFSDRECANKF